MWITLPSTTIFKYPISGEYVGVSQYVKSEDLLDMPQLNIIINKVLHIFNLNIIKQY